MNNCFFIPGLRNKLNTQCAESPFKQIFVGIAGTGILPGVCWGLHYIVNFFFSLVSVTFIDYRRFIILTYIYNISNQYSIISVF